ncbi:MAG: aspartate carbamoyltransferase catalytic subunit [Pseudomonadota bacterium]
MTTDAPEGWDGILDEGEHILWQGRPDGKVVIRATHVFTFIFGTFFAGFALFWMIMASAAPGPFWMFGLLHFSVGIGVMIGPLAWPAWVRRHTWYTLTDRRAFIATDIPFMGRKLQSYEISPKTPLEYEAGQPASLYFAHEYQRTKNGSRRKPIGFERIDEGETVYRLVRDVQRSVE